MLIRDDAVDAPGRNESGVIILGTSSGVGKTLMTLAFCRWLSTIGVKVSPFKTMSMQSSPTSFRTGAGPQIHVHQAHQALAARTEPRVDMNPVIFRQVAGRLEILVAGRSAPELVDAPVEQRVKALRTAATDAYRRVARDHAFVVIEGCGSPVELNIKERDISNLWVAATFDVPCVLVTSAERTGVFASIVGTLALLSEIERRRIRAFIVNKFHGDPGDFRDGVRILEARLGIPCLGVIPFLAGLENVCNEHEPVVATRPDVLNEEIDRWTTHVCRYVDIGFLRRSFLPVPASTTLSG